MDIYLYILIAVVVTAISRDMFRTDVRPEVTRTVASLVSNLQTSIDSIDDTASLTDEQVIEEFGLDYVGEEDDWY